MEHAADPTMPMRLKRGAIHFPLANLTTVNLRSTYGPFIFTNNNTVTRADGPSSNLPSAAEFVAASSQYLSVTDSPELSLGGGSFSILCWAYIGTEVASGTIAGQFLTTGNQRSWWIRELSSSHDFQFVTSVDGTASVTSDTTLNISTSTWYMLHCYFDARRGVQGIQVNRLDAASGGLVETAQTGVFDSTGAITVGARAGGSDFLTGRVSSLILIKGRVISDAEHFWFYNFGAGRDLARGC